MVDIALTEWDKSKIHIYIKNVEYFLNEKNNLNTTYSETFIPVLC